MLKRVSFHISIVCVFLLFCLPRVSDAGTAIKDFTYAIRINSEHAKAYYWRALAKQALGQETAAETDFEKAKTLNPTIVK